MKIYRLYSLVSCASTTILAAVLPIGVASSHAAPNPSTLDADSSALQQSALQRVDWDEGKRHKLRHAYWLLENADHDYHGHKDKAREEIKKAGEIMGMDLHGEKFEREPQWESDRRLKEAKTLLKEVTEETGGHREHEHLRLAIKEIDKALEVK